MSEEKDCIFCKIVRGELPNEKIYESDSVLAFLDIKPVSKGHVLIIPKKHFSNLLDLPTTLVSEIIDVAKKIASLQLKNLKADGFNFTMNNFPGAGQIVMHAHFHLMARFPDDKLELWPGKDMSPKELNEIAEKLKEGL